MLVALWMQLPTLYSLGLWGWKSSGTQGRISSGCPPSTSQNSGVSWPWVSSVISALPFRSFLLIFSAKSLQREQVRWQVWAPQTAAPPPALPGLGGAAQRGLAPAPHQEVEAVVQEENKPGGER